MTGKMVGWAYDQVCGSPTTKAVLVKLADNANDLGVAFPSLQLIVEQTELTKRSVIDHLNKLEDMGLITIERREENGVHFTNRYRLNVPDYLRKGKEQPERRVHHKKLRGQQRVVGHDDSPNNELSAENSNHSEPRSLLVQPTTLAVVNLTQTASEPGTQRGESDANPPAPPIEINPQTNPQTEPPQNAGAREAEPVVETNKPITPEPEPPAFLRRYSEDFNRFVAAWPRGGEGLEEIHTAWRAVTHRPPIEDMLRAVGLYVGDVTAENAKRPADNQKPWCNAVTWLKNRRWEGYLAKEARAAEMARSQPLQEKPWGAHPAATKLLDEFGAERFNHWFRPCTLAVVDGIPVLSAPNTLIRDTIAAQYIDSVERAFGKTVVVQ